MGSGLRLAPGGRYLLDEAGAPFFWLADTPWSGPLLASEEDWEQYLADRQRKGFTVIHCVTTQWRATPASAEGEVAYEGSGPIRINHRFFDRIERRVRAINDHGMVAACVLLWDYGPPDRTPGELHERYAVELASYIVDRLRELDTVWILAGDGDYMGERARRWQRIGRQVFEGRDGLVAMHSNSMSWPYDAFEHESWLHVWGYQSGHGDDERTIRWIYSGPPTTRWRELAPHPIINLEPPYEGIRAYQSGRPHTDYNVRRAVWWSLLSLPPAGVGYGAHGLWSWETEPRVPIEHPNAGVAPIWREAMALHGSAQMGHLGSLVRSLPWWELRPAQELLGRQSERPAGHIAVASALDGGLLLAYTPLGEGILLRHTPATARWFDPRHGTCLPAEVGPDGAYAPPAREDWVLVAGDEALLPKG